MEPTGQMTFVTAPRIVIEFDPEAVEAGCPSGFADSTFLEPFLSLAAELERRYFWDEKPTTVARYIAWPEDLPAVVGCGSSEDRALVDLAQELRARAWRDEDELTPAAQLAWAAARLGTSELSVYLKGLAATPELSEGYDLVLR